MHDRVAGGSRLKCHTEVHTCQGKNLINIHKTDACFCFHVKHKWTPNTTKLNLKLYIFPLFPSLFRNIIKGVGSFINTCLDADASPPPLYPLLVHYPIFSTKNGSRLNAVPITSTSIDYVHYLPKTCTTTPNIPSLLISL